MLDYVMLQIQLVLGEKFTYPKMRRLHVLTSSPYCLPLTSIVMYKKATSAYL